MWKVPAEQVLVAHAVWLPVHARDLVLLKHCVIAVAPATEFGNPEGHAVHAVPAAFRKYPALQVMVIVQLHAVPVHVLQVVGHPVVVPVVQVLARV